MEYRFCVDENWVISDSNVVEIAGRLDQVGFGLIVGPHGSGKTTLLHSLGPWLSERFVDTKHLQLQASPSRAVLARRDHARRTARIVFSQQSRLCDGGLMIVDGAEQLGRLDLARLLRRIRRRRQAILATSHLPLRGMTVLHETNVSSNLVQSLTQSLVSNASHELVDFVNIELRKRDLSTLTNLRDLWFELYDTVQNVVEKGA
jgi:GTPase SAR1 family protein